MLEVDIRCRAGAFTLHAAFSAPSDSVLGVFGASGAGKTTLLHALAGVLRPEHGTICMDGEMLFSCAAGIDRPIEARGIGYVFQEGRLFPHLSVAGNLDYGARRAQRLRPTNARPRVEREELIELLGLASLLSRRTVRLSGGERQRVAFARALLAQPRLLLLDEPLAALDGARKLEVIDYIGRLRAATRVPMVLVSHAIDEVARLADAVVVLENGHVLTHGPLEQVLMQPELIPIVGLYETSSMLSGTITEAGGEHTLAAVTFAGGTLRIAAPRGLSGASVRVRVRASDVALARDLPRDISIANTFQGVIRTIESSDALTDLVLVDLNGATLGASITRESRLRMQLRPGEPVWALVKAVALLSSNR